MKVSLVRRFFSGSTAKSRMVIRCLSLRSFLMRWMPRKPEPPVMRKCIGFDYDLERFDFIGGSDTMSN